MHKTSLTYSFDDAEVKHIQSTIIEWYHFNARDLPWRHPGITPWGILVCEVMSQQTPVSRVAPIWVSWMERWPDPACLATASPSEVIVAWGRLGYPRRALRLRECAQAIVERFDGRVPAQRDDLLGLPGIGPYTADAVLAFAFCVRTTVLDTNIRRILARWHGEALAPPSERKTERERAQHLLPHDANKSSQWNMAIMELAALVCTAKSPYCEKCVAQQWCIWRLRGYPDDAHKRHRKTQKFEGTLRQARGQIMAPLRKNSERTLRYDELKELCPPNALFDSALNSLIADGLVEQYGTSYSLPRTR